MRSLVLILCVLLLSTSFSLEAATSSSLMAEAISLLQKGQKKTALKKLEKAFEISQDPEEIEMIGALIIEAAPLDYERRGSYLRYLVGKSASHADYGKWLKELGDRAFDKGSLVDAEDWYLRSLPHQDSKRIVQYKLAWVYWNQKKRVKAFETFLDVYEESDPEFHADLFNDLARLWWETGPLPSYTFKRLAEKIDPEARTQILRKTLEKTPAQKFDIKLVEQVLKQIKEHPQTAPYFDEKLADGIFFKEAPCLLFKSILKPGDQFPSEMLLLCIRSPSPLEPHRLLAFLERMDHEKNEKTAWAYAEILEKRGEALEAAYKMIEPEGFETRSEAYLSYLEQILLYLQQKDFEEAMNMIVTQKWELLITALGKSPLLTRLQAIDPGTWLAFQEKNLNGEKEKPKSFLIKKAVFEAGKEPVNWKELNSLLEEIFSKDLDVTEKGIRDQFSILERNPESLELPDILNENFTRSYQDWLSDIDLSLNLVAGSSTDWKIIAKPILERRIAENVEALQAEIDEAQMPSGMEGQEEEFQKQKDRLKENLSARYSQFTKGLVERPSVY